MILDIDESRGDHVSDVMGVTDERMKKMKRIIYAALITGDTITESMALIAKDCANETELAYAMFTLGQLSETIKISETLKSLVKAVSDATQSGSFGGGNMHQGGGDPFNTALNQFMSRPGF